jgi:hypothetical protein
MFSIEVAFSRPSTLLYLLLLNLLTVLVPLIVTFVTKRGNCLSWWVSHRNVAAELTFPFVALVATMMIFASLAEVLLLVHFIGVCFLSFDIIS